jgi:dTDP-4-amino-4,6-dideoxygalactose transaminase
LIPFNRAPVTGNEEIYVLDAMRLDRMSGDGVYGKRCQDWFEHKFDCEKALLTPSCTAALEMAAFLIDIGPGDEVIMPSYTFVSTANAFAVRGAKVVFVDIRPDTMNLDESIIQAAITSKTKAIVVVHYAGVACEMAAIMSIANSNGLIVVEDAAQGMMSSYNGKPLGSIGHLGCISLHDTKNYTSGGEGGVLIVNDKTLVDRAEIIREKGTNRSQFFLGAVDKYTWVDLGSSYLLSELQAAYLWGQLEMAESVLAKRLAIWDRYHQALLPFKKDKSIDLPIIPQLSQHNAHMYFIKLQNEEHRTDFINSLKSDGVVSAFHYIPLHSSPAGMKLGRFHGTDKWTTTESKRLVRLPVFYNMSDDELDKVIRLVSTNLCSKL